MKILLNRIKNCFSSVESVFKTLIWLLIPLMTFFSILSDRRPFNYFNLALYAVETALILFYAFKYKKFVFDSFAFLIVIFNTCILISQLLNLRIFEFPRTILLMSMFSIVFYQYVVSLKNKNSVFFAFLLGGLLFAAFFVLYYRSSIIRANFADRIGEEFSDQNDLSKNIAIMALLSLVLVFRTKKWKRLFPLISYFIFLAIVLLAGSISNLLTLLVLSFVGTIICTSRKNKLFVAIAIVGVIGLAILSLKLPFMSYFNTRIKGIISSLTNNSNNAKADGSALDRLQILREALRLFASRPVLGYGYDQVQYYTHGYGPFSHNNFAELLACFGIVGFLAYETLLIYPIINGFIHEKKNHNVLLSVLYFFVFQMFLVIFRKKMEFLILPVAYSIMCHGYTHFVSVRFMKLKPIFSLNKPFAIEEEKEYLENKDKSLMIIFDAIHYSRDQLCFYTNYYKTFSQQRNITFVVMCNEVTEELLHRLNIYWIKPVILRFEGDNKVVVSRKLSDVIDEFKPSTILVDGEYYLSTLFASGVLNKRKIVTVFNNDKTRKFALRKASNSKKTKVFLIGSKNEIGTRINNNRINRIDDETYNYFSRVKLNIYVRHLFQKTFPLDEQSTVTTKSVEQDNKEAEV